MTVIPMKSLFIIVAIWTMVDIVDMNFFHWFKLGTTQLIDRVYWESALIIFAWAFYGKKVPA